MNLGESIIGTVSSRSALGRALTLAILAAAAPPRTAAADIGLLAFGDSGYTYEYLEDEPLSPRAFAIAELDDWHTSRAGPAWGFAHLALDGDTGEVALITTPDEGSGVPEVAFRYPLVRRSDWQEDDAP